MRLSPDPQSESSVAVLGVRTSAWPAPIEALAGKAAVHRLFNGKPNCQPLKLTADVPVLNSSTHSRFVSAFCGSYMISLRITSACDWVHAKVKRTVNKQQINFASWCEMRFISDSSRQLTGSHIGSVSQTNQNGANRH